MLFLPAPPALKEWAYAGFTFMWIAAVVAHYLAGDGALSLLPVVLLGFLAVCTLRARRIAAGPPRRCWRTRRLAPLLGAAAGYRTDVFFCVVGRTALTRVSDSALVETMGRFEEVADRRMPIFGAMTLRHHASPTCGLAWPP